MKQRNSLNSQILKQEHSNVYQGFFSKCDLVVSSPHFFTWAGEYVGYWGGVMTLQKLPFRLYVGLETDPKAKAVRFAPESQSFCLGKNKFQPDQYEHSAQVRLLEFINQFLSKSKNKAGLKIHLLSEIPFGGTGSAGALCSALSLAILLKTGGVKPKNVKEWPHLPSKKLVKNESFNRAFRLAWKMMAAYRGWETSGAPIFTTLLPAKCPIYYFLTPNNEQNLPLKIDGNYDIIDKIKYQGGTLNELFNIKDNLPWPIDFGLLYIGEPRGTQPYSTGQPKEDMEQVSSFVEKHFNKQFTQKTDNIWQANLKVMNFLSCQVLIALGEMLKQGARQNVVRKLLEALDKHQALFLTLGCLPKHLGAVSGVMHQQISKLDSLGCGLKPVSTTKKDIALFALPHGQARQALEDIIPMLTKTLEAQVFLGYASWMDGIEEQGVLIEQDLERSKHSDFIAKETIFITEYNQTRSCRRLLTPSAFKKQFPDIDLVLDQQSNTIYIKGKALTSKHLHSSKATIALLKELLKSKERQVSNNSLPKSSYSQDRYELQGKLVQPLVKAFRQLTKTDLPLKVSGSVTDFKIDLSPCPITIWIKEK